MKRKLKHRVVAWPKQYGQVKKQSLFTSLIDSYTALHQATPKSFFIREDINKVQLIFIVIGLLHEGIEMRVFDVCPELRTLNVHKS